MQIVTDALTGIQIGLPVTSGNLTMFPLLFGTDDEPDYLTLDEALAGNLAAITEVSEGGSVPELLFVNKGDRPILLVDGEELIGAKQNRVLNLTILVPANAEVKIPVSCVEQGRWSYRSRAFAASPRAHFAEGRAMKMDSVSSSMRESGDRRGDQHGVWEGIDHMFSDLKVSSETSAMADIYETYSDELDEKVEAFEPGKGQAGGVFTIDGEVIGFDLFDSPVTFRKLLPKLVSSYALQGLGRRRVTSKGDTTGQSEVEKLLASVVEAKAESFAAVGEGEDVRMRDRDLTAAALVARNRLIHLCAFRKKRID